MLRQVQHGPSRAVGLATLLFAVDDVHSMNLGWLANRHAIICVVFGGLAFLAHLRWRESGRGSWLLLSPATMGLALFCGESALGAAAYLVAWQLTLDKGSWLRRLGGIAPQALLILAWRLVYNDLGYGISGSDLYVDPANYPLPFALALLERWPELQSSQWLGVPMDVVMSMPSIVRLGAFALGLATCVFMAWLLFPLLRRSGRQWGRAMDAATPGRAGRNSETLCNSPVSRVAHRLNQVVVPDSGPHPPVPPPEGNPEHSQPFPACATSMNARRTTPGSWGDDAAFFAATST